MTADATVQSSPWAIWSLLAAHLKKPALITLARLAGAALAFALQLILARSLSPDHLGLYFTGVSVATLLATFAAMGYPNAMVRFVWRYKAKDREAWRRRFMANALRDTVLLSLFGLVLLIAIAQFVLPASDLGWALVLVAPLIPAIALMRIAGGYAIAHNRPFLGYLPDTLGRPLLLFLSVALLVLLQSDITLTKAAVLTTLSGAVLAALQLYLLGRALSWKRSDAPAEDPPGQFKRLDRVWRRTSIGLILPALFAGLLVEVVLAWSAVFVTPDSIAILAITAKLAFLTGFVGQALLQIDMPKISKAYFANDTRSFRRTWTRSVTISLGLALAALIFFALTGRALLGLFGDDYVAGMSLLIVMSVAVLARIPGMYAVQVLTLAGEQRLINRALVPIIIAALLLIALLAAAFGVIGVGIATVLVLLLHSTVFSAFAYTRTWRRRSMSEALST